MRALGSNGLPLGPAFVLAGLVAGLVGCGQPGLPFEIQIVSGSGARPISGAGTLTVTVAQQGALPIIATSPIVDGEFMLDLPIGSYGAVSVITADIARSTGGRLIGATTAFRPLGYPFVRLVVGEPGTCTLLTAPRLTGARLVPGLALVEANLISIGGLRDRVEPVASVDVFSPVLLTSDALSTELDVLSPPFGATRLVSIPATTQLVALDTTHAIRFEAGLTSTMTRATPLTLHSGAGDASALASVAVNTLIGVAVVGGRAGDGPVPDVTIVFSDGTTRSERLRFARANASAAVVSDGILVAGGQAMGEPLFEWISLRGLGQMTFGDGLSPRTEGVLVASPDRTQALYLLGREGMSLPSSTYLLSGCPTACAFAAGPDTTSPRTGAASAARAGTTVVLGGRDLDGMPSSTVEEVAFGGMGPMIDVLGELVSARGDTTAVTLGGGTILVAGGEGRESLLDTMELCFPRALDPIVLPAP